MLKVEAAVSGKLTLVLNRLLWVHFTKTSPAVTIHCDLWLCYTQHPEIVSPTKKLVL